MSRVYLFRTAVRMLQPFLWLFGSLLFAQSALAAPAPGFTILDGTTDIKDNGGGNYTYHIYSEPRLIFTNAEGQLEERPSDWHLFHQMAGSQLQNTGAPGYTFGLPRLDSPEYTISSGEMEYMSAGIKAASDVPVFSQSITEENVKTTLSNVYPNVDFIFTDHGRYRQKEIILNKKPDIQSGEKVIFWEEYTLPIDTEVKTESGLVPDEFGLETEENVVVTLSSGEMMNITGAVIFDSVIEAYRGDRLTQRVVFDKANNKLSVGILVDGDYLLDASLVYPVTIDPIYCMGNCTQTNSYFWEDNNGVGGIANNVSFIWMGYYASQNNPLLAFVPKFSFSGISLPANATVTSADLRMKFNSTPYSNFSGSLSTRAYMVNASVPRYINYNSADLTPVSSAMWIPENASPNDPLYSWNVLSGLSGWNGQGTLDFVIQPEPRWTSGAWSPPWFPRVITFRGSGADAPYLEINFTTGSSGSLPDVTMTGHGVSQTATNPNQTINVQVNFRNSGGTTFNSPGSNNLYYYFSRNHPSFDPVDFISLDTFGNLPPGQASSESQNITIPSGSVPGIYYISYWLDVDENNPTNPNGKVLESNELDNRGYDQITVGSGSDILPDGFQPNTVTNNLSPGDSFGVTGGVKNYGPQVVASVPYRVELKSQSGSQTYLIAQGSQSISSLVPTIDPNASLIVNWGGQIPNGIIPGTYDIVVTLDPNNIISDPYRPNNSMVISSSQVTIQNNNDVDNDGIEDFIEQLLGTPTNSPTQNNAVIGSSGYQQFVSTIRDIARRIFAADPVNVRNGALQYQQTDFELPGRGVPIIYTRTYNSRMADVTGRLGYGWNHSYNVYVYRDAADNSLFFNFGGQMSDRFATPDNGVTYVAPLGAQGTVSRDASNNVVYRTLDGTSYTFGQTVNVDMSMLTSITDRNGNAIILTYITRQNIPLLDKVRDASGREIQFTYGAASGATWDKVVQVADLLGGQNPRVTTYEYDANDNLVRVRRNRAYQGVVEWSEDIFTYDTNHLLQVHTDPRGTELHNVYDTNVVGRVTEQYEHNPRVEATGARRLIYRLGYIPGVYAPAPGSTTCTEVENHTSASNFYVTRDCFDANDQLVYRSEGALPGTLYQHDANGMVTRMTDPNGNITDYEYDNSRRLTREILPDTQSHETEIRYSYENDFNQLTGKVEITSSSQSTITSRSWSYIVDPLNGNRLGSVDPLGGVITYVYDNNGNLSSMTDKNNHTTIYTYDQAGNYLASDSITVTKPDSTTELVSNNYQYDIYGNQTRHTTPRGFYFNYSYDTRGNLRQEMNPLNEVINYTYDLEDHRVATSDNLNRVTNYVYDTDINASLLRIEQLHSNNLAENIITQYNYNYLGDKTADVDPLGRQTSYQYDSANRLVQVTTPLDDTTYTLDNNGNKNREVNSLGYTTDYTYDSRNQNTVIRKFIDVGANQYIETRSVYDGFGRAVQSVDGMGNQTVMAYDLLDRVTSTIDREGAVTTYRYDNVGNLLGRRDSLAQAVMNRRNSFGDSMTYQYDELNRVVKQINAKNRYTITFYDADSNVERVIDRQDVNGGNNSHVTTYLNDQLGRVLVETNALQQTITTVYDSVGNIHSVADPSGNLVLYTYDDFNRLVLTQDQLADTTSYTYDKAGNIIGKQYADGSNISFVYDALNRLVNTTDQMGFTVIKQYDAVGNLIQETDKNYNVINYEYDLLGRLISETDPVGVSTVYVHDNNNNLLSQYRLGKRIAEYIYDAEDRVISRTQGAVTDMETYTYDTEGNLVGYLDGDGNRETYTYDSLNRVLVKTIIGTSTYAGTNDDTFYSYDNWDNILDVAIDPPTLPCEPGLICTQNDPNPTYQRQTVYDVLNRSTLETHSFPQFNYQNYTVSRVYDSRGNVQSITDGAGRTTNYEYDAKSRLDRVLLGTELVADYTYDFVDNVIRIDYGNGLGSDLSYDQTHRITGINTGTSTPYWLENYIYDPEGNMSSRFDQFGNFHSFQYDSRHQLKDIDYYTNQSGSHFFSIMYDDWGNRVLFTGPNQTVSYMSRPDSDQLSGYTNSNFIQVDMVHDKRGNVVEKSTSRLGKQVRRENFEWDINNRLLAMRVRDLDHPSFMGFGQPVNSLKFNYDENGNRVRKSVMGTNTFYINNGLVVLNEVNNIGTVEDSIIYGLDQLARVDSQGNIIYNHQDALGSTVLTTDSNGNIVTEYEYDAFGNIIGQDGDGGESYLYTGQEYDPESELHYYNARYYDANTGRFLSRDPHPGLVGDAVSRNRYAYVNNNPLRYTDPSGEEETGLFSKFMYGYYPGTALIDFAKSFTIPNARLSKDDKERMDKAKTGADIIEYSSRALTFVDNIPKESVIFLGDVGKGAGMAGNVLSVFDYANRIEEQGLDNATPGIARDITYDIVVETSVEVTAGIYVGTIPSAAAGISIGPSLLGASVVIPALKLNNIGFFDLACKFGVVVCESNLYPNGI